ncbi:MAG: hypothetical protein EAZ51_05970 [Sphingobacteriales bacterium]|nr:MAG: hypothetical protein EAZ64_06865 [Sphingobacteriales bacterium]TAF80438.1 MAG: hypothetical protein EAZ51_05970 [Sphingobacteriales bacterium]
MHPHKAKEIKNQTSEILRTNFYFFFGFIFSFVTASVFLFVTLGLGQPAYGLLFFTLGFVLLKFSPKFEAGSL